MDNKAIETLAVNAVKDSIVVSKYLDQIISDNDKEPSWDGFIYIYEHESKKKDCLKGRLAVQVKGKKNNNFSKKEISFPVSLVDLCNYLNNGGIIYFVVYISPDGRNKKIYYIELPPVKIKDILENKTGKKSINLSFTELPLDVNEMTDIIINCYTHCTMQSSFANAELISLDELLDMQEKQKYEVVVPFTCSGGFSAQELLKNDLYAYLKSTENNLCFPIREPLKSKNTMAIISEKLLMDVKIGNRIFYRSIKRITSPTEISLVIGESFSITIINGRVAYKYKECDNLRQAVADVDFFLTLLEKKELTLENIIGELDLSKNPPKNIEIQHLQNFLNKYKRAVHVLDILNCTQNLIISKMTKSDWNNLEMLYKAMIEMSPIQMKILNEKRHPILRVNIQSLCFALYYIRDKNGNYFLEDFFAKKLDLFIGDSKEKVMQSQFFILQRFDYLKYSNIRYDIIVSSFKKISKESDDYFMINYSLLEMLAAYDMSEHNKKDLINAAKEISRLLLENEDHSSAGYYVSLINYLQIVRRERDLSQDEISQLYSIIESQKNSKEILIGTYLLLGNNVSAKKHFETLSLEAQKEFEQYPIFNFFNKS